MDLAALILKSSSTKAEALLKLRALSASVSADLFGGEYHPDAAEAEFADWVKKTSQMVKENLDAKTAGDTFAAAEKTIKSAETVVLYLPFVLPAENIAEISAKINSLLEIKIDPSLIAGCAIAKNGVYKDYSVRARLSEKHEEISQILKSKIYD